MLKSFVRPMIKIYHFQPTTTESTQLVLPLNIGQHILRYAKKINCCVHQDETICQINLTSESKPRHHFVTKDVAVFHSNLRELIEKYKQKSK